MWVPSWTRWASGSPSAQHPGPASPAPILPHTVSKAAPSQPSLCPRALSLVPFPVIHLDRAIPSERARPPPNYHIPQIPLP